MNFKIVGIHLVGLYITILFSLVGISAFHTIPTKTAPPLKGRRKCSLKYFTGNRHEAPFLITKKSWNNKKFLLESVGGGFIESADRGCIDTKDKVWLSMDQVEDLSQVSKLSPRMILSRHIDVTAYGCPEDYPYVDGKQNSECSVDLEPLWFRLRKGTPLLTSALDLLNKDGEVSLQHYDDNYDIKVAEIAASTTLRWCSDFVERLNLCPWAKSSLMNDEAIRIKIVPQREGLDEFETIIRKSAGELIDVTGGIDPPDRENDEDFVDPNVAITFVVAVPSNMAYDYNALELLTSQNHRHEADFDFYSFYDFSTDMEDRLMEEVEEAGNEDFDFKSDEYHGLLGNEVTMAPFHNEWAFLNAESEEDLEEFDDSYENEPADFDEDDEDENIWNAPNSGENETPLNYEKKTPYPTVSLVRTSAIVKAGVDATEKISSHNEEVLNMLGSHALAQLYRENVLNGYVRRAK